MNEIQHFGITVHRRRRSRRFYAGALRFPFIGETVNRGARTEKMHGIPELVNMISWYQLGDAGMESFYLPRHPARAADVADMREPGYRYLAFRVNGFDDYVRQIVESGLEPARSVSRGGRCFGLRDPDGIHLLFFDTGESSPVGHVSGLKEAGLVVSDISGYEDFFSAIGFEKTEEGAYFLEDIFGLSEPAALYGHVRLIAPEKTNHRIRHRSYPGSSGLRAAPRSPLPEPGIRHLAFYVDDIDLFYEEGIRAGLAFVFEPEALPGGNRTAYFLDPEGNVFEAMQVKGAARAAVRLAGEAVRSCKSVAAVLRRAFTR